MAGLGRGTSNEPHSDRKEYSRCGARGHLAVSFGVTTAGVYRRDVAAAMTGSRTELYLNEISKGILQSKGSHHSRGEVLTHCIRSLSLLTPVYFSISVQQSPSSTVDISLSFLPDVTSS